MSAVAKAAADLKAAEKGVRDAEQAVEHARNRLEEAFAGAGWRRIGGVFSPGVRYYGSPLYPSATAHGRPGPRSHRAAEGLRVTWQISIPHQHRDESLIDTASHCRKLGQDDARVMRQIVLTALMDGVAKTAGELLDHLEGLAPGERRALLDQARVAAGLPDTEEVDFRRSIRHHIEKVHTDPSLQSCHGPDGSAVPTTPTGSWRAVNVRRWYCDEHRHLAAPNDMADLGSGIRLSPSGVPIPVSLDDQREQAAAESHRAQQQARHADRAVEAAVHAEHEQAKRAAFKRELPPHLRELV
jgi:hypothetical protein